MIIEGRVRWFRPSPAVPSTVESPAAALRAVAAELRRRAERADGQAAAVLRAQAMMAEDPVLLERAERSGSVSAAAESFGIDNADLWDVVRRATGAAGPPARAGGRYVLVARELSAVDVAALDPAEVAGILTVAGGPTTHAAILARAKGIPTIMGYPEAASLRDGELVRVDTTAHAPPPGSVRGRVSLLANLNAVDEARQAVAIGAEGIGLLRTEFLFPDPEHPPGPTVQTAAYQAVVDTLAGRPVTIRLLDAGDRDAQPLGVRGLRWLRGNGRVLDDQLAAIAAVTGPVSVTAPMVSTVDDARWLRARCAAYGLTRVGAMIEVPAAALCAEEILAEVDFASVGTNDLAQFTFAADRRLAQLSSYQDASHPAVLRLVEMVAHAGDRLGKPVVVCGEAAADPATAALLVGLGVTGLSTAPAALPAIRRLFR